MLQEGSLIQIIKSDELEELAMGDFDGLEGTIVTDMTETRKSAGYMVKITRGVPTHAQDGIDTWFVPAKSVKELKI